MYSYFTKDEIEAKLSKVEACGNVVVDMKKGSDAIFAKFGDAPFRSFSADDVAKKITSNENACAIVDCDEGMMVFKSTADRMEYRG